MTGFAQVHAQITDPRDALNVLALTVELKSVNSRYLDLSFKLADELRAYEGKLRELISARIKRGKLECRFSMRSLNADDVNTETVSIQKDNLEALLANLKTVQDLATSSNVQLGAPSALELLKWPGITFANSAEFDSTDTPQNEVPDGFSALFEQSLTALLNQAISEFVAARMREGEQTAKVMLGYGQQIEQIVLKLESRLPSIQSDIALKFQDKVKERLLPETGKLGLQPEEVLQRINQELVLLALRSDVAEEISRLRAHCQELASLLQSAGPVGKKLDFLMQEFNREANTLGSKAANHEISKTSRDLKVLI